MPITSDNYEEQVKLAEAAFKDFIPERTDYGNSFTVVNWHSRKHPTWGIRYLFDYENHSCTITGGYGEAVIQDKMLTITPESFAKMFRPSNAVNLVSIARCGSFMYTWDVGKCRRDLELNLGKSHEDIVNYICSTQFKDYISDRLQDISLNDEQTAELSEVDGEFWTWVDMCGRSYSHYVYKWIVGMQMAMRILPKRNYN